MGRGVWIERSEVHLVLEQYEIHAQEYDGDQHGHEDTLTLCLELTSRVGHLALTVYFVTTVAFSLDEDRPAAKSIFYSYPLLLYLKTKC